MTECPLCGEGEGVVFGERPGEMMYLVDAMEGDR